MEARTKYELWQEKDAETKKRENNIKQLESLQERITALKAVIPVSSDDHKEDKVIQVERAFIYKMDYDVNQMIYSEKRTLEAVISGAVYPEAEDDTIGVAEI